MHAKVIERRTERFLFIPDFYVHDLMCACACVCVEFFQCPEDRASQCPSLTGPIHLFLSFSLYSCLCLVASPNTSPPSHHLSTTRIANGGIYSNQGWQGTRGRDSGLGRQRNKGTLLFLKYLQIPTNVWSFIYEGCARVRPNPKILI